MCGERSGHWTLATRACAGVAPVWERAARVRASRPRCAVIAVRDSSVATAYTGRLVALSTRVPLRKVFDAETSESSRSGIWARRNGRQQQSKAIALGFG